ncbi:MAG: hypothetical protein HOP17_00410 [Acidobacteria bacterium]|nr:hypothetical protein [Acidobacteriota bacterium]
MPERSSTNIAFVIPRGEVIRNFVHSGTLDAVAHEASVSLISVSFDDEINRSLEEKYGEVYRLKELRERWLVRFEREILETAHNRWVWSPASRSRVRLHDAAAVTIRQKFIRAAKKAVSRPIANRLGVSALSKIERASSLALRTTDEYLNLMKKLKPSLVFNGSQVHSRVATQAVQAAQWLKIPTATFIFSWDNLTSQGRILLPYDYYLVWNEHLKTELLKMYRRIRPEHVFVTGTPQFDFHFREEFYQTREQFCAAVGADPERQIIYYTTGMANHMPGEPELVEGIADVLREIGGVKPPQLLVRVYPKDLTDRFEPLKKDRPDILFQKTAWEKSWLTPKFEDSFGLINALRHCALGINIASTVSLELCMFDKPVINVGYNPKSVPAREHRFADFYQFDHYQPLVASGAVEVADNPLQMREMIDNYLIRPEHRKNERQALIERMFGSTLDGGSAQRVAKTLLKIAAARNGAKA